MTGSWPAPRFVPSPWLSRLIAAAYGLDNRGLERPLLGERRRQPLGTVRGEVLNVDGGTAANLPLLRCR